ncbi:laminin subunit gamma-1-like, partial [Tropilaelaps mercedesae]
MPQRCLPPYTNVAYNRAVNASNTCGIKEPQQFCAQSPYLKASLECEFCDDRYERSSHSSRYITDFAGPDNLTWWQSETLMERVDEAPVDLTID